MSRRGLYRPPPNWITFIIIARGGFCWPPLTPIIISIKNRIRKYSIQSHLRVVMAILGLSPPELRFCRFFERPPDRARDIKFLEFCGETSAPRLHYTRPPNFTYPLSTQRVWFRRWRGGVVFLLLFSLRACRLARITLLIFRALCWTEKPQFDFFTENPACKFTSPRLLLFSTSS